MVIANEITRNCIVSYTLHLKGKNRCSSAASVWSINVSLQRKVFKVMQDLQLRF